jgi:amino acid transporter/mannitol/fructose-specific phosphotransferase system IIA component (Ntr-type)
MDSSKKPQLLRQLNFLDVFSISSGAMISSGLFILPGLIYAQVGPAVILVYLFAGLSIVPVLFSKAELTSAMPRAGGDYFFIERSMGSVAGSIGGIASWLSLSLKSAFALVGISVFFTLVWPEISPLQIKLIAAGFCLFFTLLNLHSVKLAGLVQNLMVLALIALLLAYVLRGVLLIDVHRYTPFMRSNSQTFFMSIGMVFVSFGGLTKAASIAEEVHNPARNVPRGMIAAFIVVILLYCLALFVTVGLLGSDQFSHSLTPLSLGGLKALGPLGMFALSFAALLAFISTANAGILAASRFPVAMSRDQLLPGIFARISPRFKTPTAAIAATGLFMIAVILLLDLESLVKVASTMKIILFLFVLLACIIMRESRILNYRPTFVSPLYPWIQILGIILYGFFLFSMGRVALLTTGVFILASVAWTKIYARKLHHSQSALIHVVERITAKELAGDSLSRELKEILRERDQIVEDRFDQLVKNGIILDLHESLEMEVFFDQIAQLLSQRLGLTKTELYRQFIEREQNSTTVIRPGLAIPHLTIPGKNRFELAIVRCEGGISFIPDQPPVYAVFILLGTLDERNFHLRALSAIAQIAQDLDFDRDWLRARKIEELRDIVLLAKRRREKL